MRKLLKGKLKRKFLRKSFTISTHSFVKPFGLDSIQITQIAIENYLKLTHRINRRGGLVGRSGLSRHQTNTQYERAELFSK